MAPRCSGRSHLERGFLVSPSLTDGSTQCSLKGTTSLSSASMPQTGQEIWRFRSDKNYHEGQGGNGPRATPTIDGDLLFTISAHGKLYALNADEWTRDMVA